VPRQTLATALLAACLVAGCGSERKQTPPPDREETRAAEPSWARLPKRDGEILVRGDASPGSHGPFSFSGRYTVRFAQVSPEDPELDFSEQTSFVARLDREAEIPDSPSVRLFRAAKREGRKSVRVDGRYFVDVEFGDYPYVIRFTPAP
jgi:hypothetical protein